MKKMRPNIKFPRNLMPVGASIAKVTFLKKQENQTMDVLF